MKSQLEAGLTVNNATETANVHLSLAVALFYLFTIIYKLKVSSW